MLNTRFVDVRSRNGLTCNAAAVIMGVSRKHMHDIETGAVSPRVSFVEKFATEFNVNINWMLTGIDVNQNEKLRKIREVLNA